MRRAFPLSCLSLGFLLLLLFPAARAAAQSTTWVGTLGDWGTPGNWSAGEPTATLDAVVPLAATPTITLAGETCRNLTTGIDLASTVRVQSGSLTVVQRIHIGSIAGGSFQQTGGSVVAAELVLGNSEAAASYTIAGGSLTLEEARIGESSSNATGFFSAAGSNPAVTISGTLRIGETSLFGCGAGSLIVGTGASGGILLDGGFTLSNTPDIQTSAFTMSEPARLSVLISALGISPIVVSGSATLAGQLLLTDAGAANGTYEVLRAGSLQGGFVGAILPSDWSWRIEGNSLLLTKGVVPVEASHWGGLKRLGGR